MTFVTKHTVATQTSLGGYAKGQLVVYDGVIWKSLIAANTYPPGDTRAWEMLT